MLFVIERYIGKEIIRTTSAVVFVLLLIFISNRLVRYLADAAAGDIPSNVIWTLMGLNTVYYFVVILPLAFYLAILLALGRMYQENEMTALSACGVGYGMLYKTILILSIPITLLMVWVSLSVVPTLAQVEYKIIQDTEKELGITGLSPGRFKEARGNKEKVMYVESISADNVNTKNVFIYAKINNVPIVLSSATGRIFINEIGERYLILKNGYRYDGAPGQASFKITRYKEYALKLESKLRRNRSLKRGAVPTSALLKSNKPRDIAELQWRISLPLSTLFLSILAIPLSRIKQRKSRFEKLIVAMLIYILYFNLLSVSRAWIGQKTISPYIGLWWVHALVFVLAMVILTRILGTRWMLSKLRLVRQSE